MKTAFLLGVLLGLAGVLAAARYAPWVDPARLDSHTTVVANGGRAETFVIRLPADRVAAAGGPGAGLRAGGWPAGAALPEGLESADVLVEQFKVRDRDDRVIGIAARHWSPTDDGPGTAWLLVLPGRGAMWLTAGGETARALDAALSAAGRRDGAPWSGEIRASFPAAVPAGRLIGGTDEFDGLDGTYTETWTITGVGESGELSGTIELATVASKRT